MKALSLIYNPWECQLSSSNRPHSTKVKKFVLGLHDDRVARSAARWWFREPVSSWVTYTPLIAICSSNDSSWQALKVSQRNPHPETYYYLIISPQGVHKFTNFIVRRNGCYHNSFQAISRRWIFGSQLGVIDPIPPHPDPPIWYSNEPSRRDLQLSKYNPFRNTYRKVARGRKLFPGSVDRVRIYHNDHCKILSGRPPFLLNVGVDPPPPPPIGRLYKDASRQHKCLFGSEGRTVLRFLYWKIELFGR